MTSPFGPIEAIIFDMDGVLIDSEPLWKIAMDRVFKSIGSQLTPQDFQRTVGLRIDEVVHFWNLDQQWNVVDENAVIDKIIDEMVELISEKPIALPGVRSTLQYLQSIEMPVAMATSSPLALLNAVVDGLKIRTYFQFLVSAENESHGKPHPAVYLTAADKLGINPTKCLVIEDSLNGIISAKAARMKVVCIPEVTHIPDPRLILADYHFKNMDEFLTEFKKR